MQDLPDGVPGTSAPPRDGAATSRSLSDAALWLLASRTPPEQLIAFGPTGFEAYGRLRYVPDPSRPGQDEADVVLPEDHLSDRVQTQRALHHLAEFTATPDECYFCVWDGHPDVGLAPDISETAVLDLPHRRYVIFRSALSRSELFAQDQGPGSNVSPLSFVWPADHSWCFAHDVDPHWAGIGAQRIALEALAADALLDVVPAVPEEPQPRYG